MDSRKARIIDALLQHLEGMDASDLKSAMAPKADKVVELEIEPVETHLAEVEMGAEGKEKGPMEVLMDESGDNAMPMAEASKEEDDMDDEDLEDLEKLLG